MQILCVYHVGVCYICFDNLLCIVNLHVASQFRILQHRLRSINNATKNQIEEYESDARLSYYSNMCCTKLRNCVQQHQMLIEYCKKLENIFTLIVLAQVMFLAMVICLVGFQLLLVSYFFEIFYRARYFKKSPRYKLFQLLTFKVIFLRRY